VVLLIYFGHVRFRGRVPGGLVAVALGTLLAWVTGIAPAGPRPAWTGLSLPVPALDALLRSLRPETLHAYFSVILPMGLFNVVGSLQNVESAEAAGDPYPTRPSLLVNGLGSLAAALFGSPFPTTIYIGHPGWKALGARAGYSILNGAFVTIIALTGTIGLIAWLVPIDAGMAIVLWIGLVISAQAFQAVPTGHAPAVVVGLLPAIGAWGASLAKAGLRAAGVGSPGGPPFSPALEDAFLASDTWIRGAFALEQGFIFTSMILAAATVAVIERRFARAGAWMLAGAALSAAGLAHAYRYTAGDTAIRLAPAWPWALGYLAVAALFFAAPLLTEPGEGHG
jgi:AGZA family xanthine/uracil permease-like MFS transporter